MTSPKNKYFAQPGATFNLVPKLLLGNAYHNFFHAATTTQALILTQINGKRSKL